MPIPKSVCYIFNNTYSASFDGVKDAPYTAKYGHPPEMKQGRGKGEGEREGEARHGKKEGEGGDGGPLHGKGVERGGKGRDKEGEGGDGGPLEARGWKGEGRKEREGGMGN